MPYLGNTAGNRFVASKAATQFSGDGSNTSFTLEHAVGSDEDILVSVDGVIQEPSVAYSVSNGTTLTFTAAPSNNSGNNIFVYYLFRTVGTVDHPSTSSLQATDATLSSTLAVTGTSTLTGKVGILGTNDLGLGLHIKEADSGVSSVSTDADQLVIENSAESGISLLAGTSSASRIAFGDSGNNKIGMVYYNHGSDYMQFSTNDTAQMKIDSTGAVTKPNQPAFNAILSGHVTISTLNAYNDLVFGTERFDQNGDYNTSDGVFTAPVTGRYLLTTSLYLFNSLDSAATYYYLNLETSNETVDVYFTTSTFLNSDTNGFNMQASVITDLSASDTAKVKIYQSGGSAQTQIAGGHSHFSGALLC